MSYFVGGIMSKKEKRHKLREMKRGKKRRVKTNMQSSHVIGKRTLVPCLIMVSQSFLHMNSYVVEFICSSCHLSQTNELRLRSREYNRYSYIYEQDRTSNKLMVNVGYSLHYQWKDHSAPRGSFFHQALALLFVSITFQL